MKKTILKTIGVTALAALAMQSSPASTRTGTRPLTKELHTNSTPGVCKALAQDYDNASKKLSLSAIEARHNGPSALNGDAGIMSQASVTMTLMSNNHCVMPQTAPSSERYASAEILCSMKLEVNGTRERVDDASANFPGSTSSIKAYDAPECDMSKWSPDR